MRAALASFAALFLLPGRARRRSGGGAPPASSGEPRSRAFRPRRAGGRTPTREATGTSGPTTRATSPRASSAATSPRTVPATGSASAGPRPRRRRLNNNAFRSRSSGRGSSPAPPRGIDVGAEIDDGRPRRLDRLAEPARGHHYRNVLAAAEKRGITPFLTLLHYSIPTWLHDPLAIREALAGLGFNQPLPELDGGLARARDGGRVREVRRLPGLEAGRPRRLLEHPERATRPGHLRLRQHPRLFRRLLSARRLQLHGAIAALLNLERANTAAYDAVKSFDLEDADGDGEPGLPGR